MRLDDEVILARDAHEGPKIEVHELVSVTIEPGVVGCHGELLVIEEEVHRSVRVRAGGASGDHRRVVVVVLLEDPRLGVILVAGDQVRHGSSTATTTFWNCLQEDVAGRSRRVETTMAIDAVHLDVSREAELFAS